MQIELKRYNCDIVIYMSDEIREGESKGITRRALLKGAAALAGALALNTITTRSDNAAKEKASQTRELSKDPDPGLEIRNFALKSFITDQDKKISKNSIGNFARYYLSSSSFPERVITIHNEYKNFIGEAFDILAAKGFNIDPLWKSVMPGLILAESSADPKTGPDIGLCQLRAPAIADARALLGKEYENADPNDPKNNIIFALTYLIRLFNNYNTPDMAIWAYNLGIGTLNQTIQAYTIEKLGENHKPDIDNTLGDPKRGPSALIKANEINTLKIIQSQAATDKLQEIAPKALENEGRFYFWKVIGAAQAYLEAEKEIFP